MPRVSRQPSATGFYHVIFRGNGRQLLFEDDDDRRYFLGLLTKKAAKFDIAIIAWCLMSNHIHLLLEDPKTQLSQAMHGLATAYARHFNCRSGHVGSVFQGRFTSVAITSDRQLLQAVRYIHENPRKAGIAQAREYRWSSFGEYLHGARVIDGAKALELVGGRAGFERLCEDERFASYYVRPMKRVSDEDAAAAARSMLDGGDPAHIKALPRARRNEALRKLREAGMSIKQIERLTGIGRSTISRATRAIK